MADDEKAMIAALDNLPNVNFEELAKVSSEVFDPKGDAEKAPRFGKRFVIAKVLNKAEMFEISGEGLETEKVASFNGVIVEFQNTKTWYEIPLEKSGGGNRPDCYSIDSIRPHANSSKVQAEKCAICVRNKFIPDLRQNREGKKRKECSDLLVAYLWNPKYDKPILLRASTMNRMPFSNFFRILGEKGIAKEMLVVKFSLYKNTEDGSVEFSGIKIEPIAPISVLTGWFKKEKGMDVGFQDIVSMISEFKQEHAEAFEVEGASGVDEDDEVPRTAAIPPTQSASKPTATPPAAASAPAKPAEVYKPKSPAPAQGDSGKADPPF